MATMTSKLITSLTFRLEHRKQMLADIEARQPEEACGLIAGVYGRAVEVVPITNEYHSKVRYRMVPEEQLSAFNRFDLQGWKLLGIYHSHPEGPNFPSAKDIAEATYPGVVYLIWFPSQGEWDCRGFLIHDSKVKEVHVSFTGSEAQTDSDHNTG